jgi:hypothetical protein
MAAGEHKPRDGKGMVGQIVAAQPASAAFLLQPGVPQISQSLP